MSVTYKAIDPESGVRWCVRIVFIGDQYGLKHCLTYGNPDEDGDLTDDPMIEFYDMDSGAAAIMRKSDDKTEAYLAEEYGQFVSRYYYSTLKMRDPLGEGSALTDWSQRGLNLDGGVDRWSVSSEFMVKAMAAINAELEERAEIERREVQDA
jgi:hypothetical protein